MEAAGEVRGALPRARHQGHREEGLEEGVGPGAEALCAAELDETLESASEELLRASTSALSNETLASGSDCPSTAAEDAEETRAPEETGLFSCCLPQPVIPASSPSANSKASIFCFISITIPRQICTEPCPLQVVGAR